MPVSIPNKLLVQQAGLRGNWFQGGVRSFWGDSPQKSQQRETPEGGSVVLHLWKKSWENCRLFLWTSSYQHLFQLGEDCVPGSGSLNLSFWKMTWWPAAEAGLLISASSEF